MAMNESLKYHEQVVLSLKYTFRAFLLISQMKIRYIYLLPFVIQIVLMGLGFRFSWPFQEQIVNSLSGLFSDYSESNSAIEFLVSVMSVAAWVIIQAFTFIVLGVISGYVTLILLSPVYAWLSEKTESEITGIKEEFNLLKFVKDVLRAIMLVLRNGMVQLLITIGLLIVGFIPVLNFLVAPALFLVTAYFYGFSILDYSHERKNLSMGESIKATKKLRFASVTLGSVFFVCYMIPWIGPFLASFISFPLVVAGTLLIMEGKKGRAD